MALEDELVVEITKPKAKPEPASAEPNPPKEAYAKINDFVIKKLDHTSQTTKNVTDLRGFFTNVDVYEDLFGVYRSCNIGIIDSQNLQQNLPISAGDIIKFVWTIPGNDKDAELEMCVYDFTSTVPHGANGAVMYGIKCCSKVLFQDNRAKTLSRSVKGTCSEVALAIFNENYSQYSKMTVVNSKNEAVTVIPNLTPMQTISFLTSFATPTDEDIPSYVVYEDRDEFIFAPITKMLLKEPFKELYYEPNLHQITDIARRRLCVIKLESRVRDNYLMLGAMRLFTNNNLIYDPVTKQVIVNKQGYSGTNTTQKPVSDLNESTSTHDTVIQGTNNYNQGELSANEYAVRSIKTRMAYFMNLYNNSLLMTIPGSPEYEIGQVIKLHIAGGVSNNRRLEGNWLITGIHHNISQLEYVCNVEMCRDSNPEELSGSDINQNRNISC